MPADINVLELVEQSLDASIQSNIRKSLEENGDEYGLAVVDLLAEFGISGRKAIELSNRMDVLMKIYGKK